ncbi:MAG TPA: hypothetical protein VIU29_09800, partial [Candidatus Deferrimicrobiaceae bacterium]
MGSFLLSSPKSVPAASMEQYCQYPPYVFQHTLPSVMILLSNAQTMSGFAYTDDVAWSHDTAGGGFNPSTKYYGYFDPDSWYDQGGNGGFSRLGAKSDGRPTTNSFDGNFLNWLTMRRIDVMKKVLTGGTGDAYESCGKDNTAYKKWVDNGGLYTPYNAGTKTMYAVFSHKTGCTGNTPSQIEKVYDPTGNSGLEKVYATKLQVHIVNFVQPDGVIQRNITRARIGLTYFNQTSGEGGQIVVPVTANFGPDDYNKIKTPSQFNGQGDEPLGEALWTVTGYYAQSNSSANVLTPLAPGTCTGSPAGCGPVYGATYPIGPGTSVDPFVQHGARSRCTKAAVLIVTDGEPCNDGNLPGNLAMFADNVANIAGFPDNNAYSPFHCIGSSCAAISSLGIGATSIPSCTPTVPSPVAANGGAVAGIEDVALWAHKHDLRPDVSGYHNVDIFIVKAFGSANSNLLKFAAVNGSADNVFNITTP